MKKLVAFFSASGKTKKEAERIVKEQAVQKELDRIRKESGIENLATIGMEDLGLSKRIVSALARADIDTVEDLLVRMVGDPKGYDRIRNLAEEGKKEISEKLMEMEIILSVYPS